MNNNFQQTLERCGLEYRKEKSKEHGNEIVVGFIKNTNFTIRDSYRGYYIVEGFVPLWVANIIHSHSVKDIRVNGHCLNPEPKEWCDYYLDGKKIVAPAEKPDMERLFPDSVINYYFGDKEKGKPYISFYHIDSELGLLRFC